VHASVCVCVRVHAYVCTNMRVRVLAYGGMHARVHAHVFVRMLTCACVCACLHVCVRMLAYVCANMRVCVLAYGCILYVCVGACMCVYICMRAKVRTCMRVCVRARTCVNARACTFSHVRVFLCVHLCTKVCVLVCVRVQGCVNADVRAFRGGCMHICVKSVRVLFLILHHLRPGYLQWGWLACTANTQTLVLLVLLLLNPLLSNHWLLLDHHGFTSTRDTAIPQKQLLNSPDAGLWIFVVSFRPYIYVLIRKNRVYTPAKIHIRCIRVRVRRTIIYTYVYIRIRCGPTLHTWLVSLCFPFKAREGTNIKNRDLLGNFPGSRSVINDKDVLQLSYLEHAPIQYCRPLC